MHSVRPALIILGLVLQACSGKPFIIKHHDEASSSDTSRIFIVNHDWHTGFVVPAAQTEAVMPFLKTRFSNTRYYEFGWGDKGFYQAQEITSGLTLQAIFWPTESVMHVVAVPYNPHRYFSSSEVVELNLADTELNNLLVFINSSFYRDEKQQAVIEKNGIYGDSQFYKGEGDYYLFNTCNKWTAKGLASAGFDISTTFKLTAGSIMSFLKELDPPADDTSSALSHKTLPCS